MSKNELTEIALGHILDVYTDVFAVQGFSERLDFHRRGTGWTSARAPRGATRRAGRGGRRARFLQHTLARAAEVLELEDARVIVGETLARVPF